VENMGRNAKGCHAIYACHSIYKFETFEVHRNPHQNLSEI
jgi:hypothetical protein